MLEVGDGVDAAGKSIKKIFALEKIEEEKDAMTAAVIYMDNEGKAAFAIAQSSPELGVLGQDWRIEKVHVAVSKARMQIQAVRDEAGDAVAVVLNIRRGKAQRLYLWHDGELRAKH